LFVLLGLETKLISGGVVSLLAGRRNPDLAAQDPKTLRIVEKIPSLCLSQGACARNLASSPHFLAGSGHDVLWWLLISSKAFCGYSTKGLVLLCSPLGGRNVGMLCMAVAWHYLWCLL
jgi:hypothetical protein